MATARSEQPCVQLMQDPKCPPGRLRRGHPFRCCKASYARCCGRLREAALSMKSCDSFVATCSLPRLTSSPAYVSSESQGIGQTQEVSRFGDASPTDRPCKWFTTRPLDSQGRLTHGCECWAHRMSISSKNGQKASQGSGAARSKEPQVPDPTAHWAFGPAGDRSRLCGRPARYRACDKNLLVDGRLARQGLLDPAGHNVHEDWGAIRATEQQAAARQS